MNHVGRSANEKNDDGFFILPGSKEPISTLNGLNGGSLMLKLAQWASEAPESRN